MAQCPMCGKIIKPDEKLCNSCSCSSNTGPKVEVDTMPDKNIEDIKKTKMNQNISGIAPEKDAAGSSDPVDTNTVISNNDYGDDKRLPLDEELITVEKSPMDDFDLSDEKKTVNPDEPLEMTRIEDAVVPEEPKYPDLDQPRDMPSKEIGLETRPEQNQGESTDKLYVMPDEMVSSSDREKLITSLQSKIPNIIKSKQSDDDQPPAAEENDFQRSRKELGKIASKPREPEAEPKTQNVPLPTLKKNGIEKEVTAYFQGSKLILPAQVKFSNGEEVNIRGHKYILKKKDIDLKSIMLLGILSVVLILAVVLGVPRAFNPHPQGQLIGLILNSRTSEVVPDAQVILDELGETAYSDENGIFRFNNMKKGEWSISASKPQYKTAAMGFTIGKGEVSVMTLSLEPSLPAAAENPKKNSKPEPAKTAPVEKYGKLTVISNASSAKVILDSKMLGPGNKTYSKIKTGEHRLVVMAEGYKDYAARINIEADENNSFDIHLDELDVKYKPSEITFEQYLSKADDMASAGNWREAAGNYTLALAKKENADIYYKRSAAYSRLGQNEQAQSDLLKASRLFAVQGKLDRSLACLNQILDKSPENTEALRERGYVRLRKADFDAAIDDLSQAVKIDDDDYRNHIALGEAYYVAGKPKDALKSLRIARKLNDTNARAYALSALASMAKGDEKDAEKYYEGFELRAGPQEREEFSADPEWQKLTDMISQKD
jgi:Flp pilus assembly protein TadD